MLPLWVLGHKVQLIDVYMLQLREGGSLAMDMVESLLGYHVKRSSLQDERRRLVTLDRV
jgi:hypothetical protein